MPEDQVKRPRSFRASDHQYALIEQRAASIGVTVGGYILAQALREPIARESRKPPLEKKAIAQMAMQLSQVAAKHDSREVATALDALAKLLRAAMGRTT